MEEYRAAKLRIFENQRATDYAITNYVDDLPPLAARQIRFSAYSKDSDLTLESDTIHFRGKPVLNIAETNLCGVHNAENLRAAVGKASATNVTSGRAKT